MEPVETKNAKLTKILQLTLFYLRSKSGEDWIYKARIMAPQRSIFWGNYVHIPCKFGVSLAHCRGAFYHFRNFSSQSGEVAEHL